LELAHMNGKKFNVDQKQNDADGWINSNAEIEEEIDYEEKGGFEEEIFDEEDFAITSISKKFQD
jgi:hypothetical protein